MLMRHQNVSPSICRSPRLSFVYAQKDTARRYHAHRAAPFFIVQAKTEKPRRAPFDVA